jgi:hypothetical protein
MELVGYTFHEVTNLGIATRKCPNINDTGKKVLINVKLSF